MKKTIQFTILIAECSAPCKAIERFASSLPIDAGKQFPFACAQPVNGKYPVTASFTDDSAGVVFAWLTSDVFPYELVDLHYNVHVE